MIFLLSCNRRQLEKNIKLEEEKGNKSIELLSKSSLTFLRQDWRDVDILIFCKLLCNMFSDESNLAPLPN